MSTGAAGDGFIWGMFEGCLSGGDGFVQRRPYHKNCGCALHKSGAICSHDSRNKHISYPIRRSWSESSLALIGNASPSPSSSPATPAAGGGGMRRTPTQLVLCKEGDDEGEGASPKV